MCQATQVRTSLSFWNPCPLDPAYFQRRFPITMVDSLWFQVRFVDTFAHHLPVPAHDTGQCGHHQGRQRCCQPWGGVGKLLFGPGQFVTLFSDVDILKLWSPLGRILKPSITEANGYLSYLIVVLSERRSAKFGQDLQRDYLSCIQEVCVDFHSVPVFYT